MNKRILNKFISYVISIACVLSVVVLPQAQAVEPQAAEPQIKNIIYMIPDGGGYAPYDLANLVKETYGGLNTALVPYASHWEEKGSLTLRDYLVGSRINNHALSGTNHVIDSAASGTALATGYQPSNGRIGLNADVKPVANLSEAAMSKGKSVGIVTSEHWTGATPAAFSVHGDDRNASLKDIYRQMVGKGIDVVLSAGFDPLDTYGASINDVPSDYKILDEKADYATVAEGDKLWGNLAGRGLNGEYLPGRLASEPTLADCTRAAIKALSGNDNGFFLMIEASDTDGGGHSNDALQTTSEYLAFEAAFEIALEFASKRDDTIIIATPDHDTGGLVLKDNMSAEAEQIYNLQNPTTFSWESTNHTLRDIPVWIYAPSGISMPGNLSNTPGDTEATRTNCTAEINELAPFAAELMGVDLDALTEELFVDVSDYGVYYAAEEEFVFANTTEGEKSIKTNESTYYVNGTPHDMGYKQALFVNEKFYVPAEMVTEEDKKHQGNKMDGLLGEGTEESPYLVKNVYDFIELSNNIENGEKYEGKYIKQTSDLNLTGYTSEYNGISISKTFAGVYDGNAHKLNVAIKGNKSVFPRVSGTVMNVGVTGSIEAEEFNASGLVHTIMPAGKLINSYSNASISGKNTSGLVYNNYGKVVNSYFGGEMTSKGYNALGIKLGNGEFNNVYGNKKYPQRAYGGIIMLTDEDISGILADELNYTINSLPEKEKLCQWQNITGKPELYMPEVIITEVTVTPTYLSAVKGGQYTLTAQVLGENNPSQEVKWEITPASVDGTAITQDGVLTISETETQTSFTVQAKSKADGSKVGICRVTVL